MYGSNGIDLTAQQALDLYHSSAIQLIATDENGNVYEELVSYNQSESGESGGSIIASGLQHFVSVDTSFEPTHIRIRAYNGVEGPGSGSGSEQLS